MGKRKRSRDESSPTSQNAAAADAADWKEIRAIVAAAEAGQLTLDALLASRAEAVHHQSPSPSASKEGSGLADDMAAESVRLGRYLTHNDAVVRDLAFRAGPPARDRTPAAGATPPASATALRRMWKGLLLSLYHCDKPLPQEAFAAALA